MKAKKRVSFPCIISTGLDIRSIICDDQTSYFGAAYIAKNSRDAARICASYVRKTYVYTVFSWKGIDGNKVKFIAGQDSKNCIEFVYFAIPLVSFPPKKEKKT